MNTKSVSIRDVQLKLLEIVKYIDDFCKNNNIEFFLIGGSALGAIRHKGFIPWDDDFDIAMTYENYKKFIKLCEEKLDSEKFYLQKERSEAWPLYFTKIKMNNTIFKEIDSMPTSHQGIFIDIFCLDNISDNNFVAVWQYFCSRMLTAQTLHERGYSAASIKKKIIMKISLLLSNKYLKRYLINQVKKYNSIYTKRVGLLFGKVKFNTAIIPRDYLGKGKLFEFENLMLPLPEKAHEFLILYFGNYMILPPVNERVAHLPVEIEL